MRILSLLIFMFSMSMTALAAQQETCTEQEKPSLLKPLENWNLISSNVTSINTAPHFGGSDLTYTLSYNHIQPANKATINKETGEIKVEAETRDNFDVIITANNFCGSISSTFNIQIDEEG